MLQEFEARLAIDGLSEEGELSDSSDEEEEEEDSESEAVSMLNQVLRELQARQDEKSK